MCQLGVDGLNTMTSMTMMLSHQKYHGCAWLWIEELYIKSYVKPILIAKTHPTTSTPTTICDIYDDQKHPILHQGANKLTPIHWSARGPLDQGSYI